MKIFCPLCALAVTLALIGCDSTGSPSAETSSASSSAESHDDHGDDHDNDHEKHGHQHDHPDTLSEAVEHIRSVGGTITDAFSNEKPDEVHDDLHALGYVIESLPELASKAGLSDEQRSAVTEAAEALMDAFGELDGTLHGGDAVKVEEVAKKIESLLAKLSSMSESTDTDEATLLNDIPS